MERWGRSTACIYLGIALATNYTGYEPRREPVPALSSWQIPSNRYPIVDVLARHYLLTACRPIYEPIVSRPKLFVDYGSLMLPKRGSGIYGAYRSPSDYGRLGRYILGAH